eukprot:4463808-Heterocapsa_arctica.AAC.1
MCNYTAHGAALLRTTLPQQLGLGFRLWGLGFMVSRWDSRWDGRWDSRWDSSSLDIANGIADGRSKSFASNNPVLAILCSQSWPGKQSCARAQGWGKAGFFGPLPSLPP